MGRRAQFSTEEEFNMNFLFIFVYDPIVNKNAEVEDI